MSQTRMRSDDRLHRIIRASPTIESILSRVCTLALPDCHLCAGCIAQTVWNHATGRPPLYGIDDIDVIYFDASDLGEEGEARASDRAARLLADVPLRLDVENEARVHLWYGAAFGRPIAPFRSAAGAVAGFPTTATAVAVAADGKMSITAPYELDDLLGLVVRPNRRLASRIVYETKVARWRRLWPEVTYLPWQNGG